MRGLRQAVRLRRVAQGLLVSSDKAERGSERTNARTLQALSVLRMPDEVRFFVPEGRRILAGGETTGTGRNGRSRPGSGAGSKLWSVALPGLEGFWALVFRWFLHRLERLSDQCTERGGSPNVRFVITQIFCAPKEALLRRSATK